MRDLHVQERFEGLEIAFLRDIQTAQKFFQIESSRQTYSTAA